MILVESDALFSIRGVATWLQAKLPPSTWSSLKTFFTTVKTCSIKYDLEADSQPTASAGS